MKLQICLLSLLSTAGVALAQVQVDVQMFETGENSLTANWASTPLTTTLIGPQTWDVNLASGGYQLDGSTVGRVISWFEPAGETGFNVVTVVNPTTLLFQSEVPVAVGIGPFALGVSDYIGNDINGSHQTGYAQVFDTATAPDGGASVGLLSLGLAGLGLLRSKFNLAQRK